MVISLANSADPDVMSNSVGFPLGLLCLPNYRFNNGLTHHPLLM